MIFIEMLQMQMMIIYLNCLKIIYCGLDCIAKQPQQAFGLVKLIQNN